jgi:hypothetical protein
VVKKLLSSSSKFYESTASLKKLDVQHLFEALNARADCGLRPAQAFGRRGEAARVCDGDKAPNEVHI